MRVAFPCTDIERTVQAVNEVYVAVEIGYHNRIDAGGVLDDRFAVAPYLELRYKFDVVGTLPLILYGQRIADKCLRASFAQFHCGKIAGVMSPDGAVKDIPCLALRRIPRYILVVIGEQVSHADVIPVIA